ncbi:MAG TPA: hypothetical protein VGC31_04265 [Paenirhodobacter sp.]
MLGNDGLWEVLAQASNDLRALLEQFASGSISGDEFAGKMQDIQTKAANALAELDDIDRQQFSGVIGSLGGLGKKLLDLIGKAKDLKATLPGASNITTGTGLTADQIDLPRTSSAPTTSVRPQAAPVLIGESGDTTTKSSTSKSSTRKTSSDMLAEVAQETAALQAEAKAAKRSFASSSLKTRWRHERRRDQNCARGASARRRHCREGALCHPVRRTSQDHARPRVWLGNVGRRTARLHAPRYGRTGRQHDLAGSRLALQAVDRCSRQP